MTHAPGPDLGPLTWVKGEIDNALARAAEGLEEAAGAAEPAARIQFAQTHLHQARGALSIVGLDGLTQFADALDQLFGAAARGEVPSDEALFKVGRRGLAAIANYLDELAHGAIDQPLRLAGLYGEIQTLRGREYSAVDLFFPDLGRRPPRRGGQATVPEAARRGHLRTLRARFERGLLGWLRVPASPEGPQAMREAVVEIERVLAATPARTLWWAAIALFDTAEGQPLPQDDTARRLCARLDAQLRRTLGGSTAVPDRLLREVLHRIAVTPAVTAHQHAVRETWALDTLVPEAGATVSDAPLGPLLQNLHGKLNNAKETWDSFCTGNAAALQRFETQLGELAQQAAQLGRPPFSRLLVGLDGFLQWLRKDPLQLNEALSLEIATALLLGESALDRGGPDPAFSAQVADTLKRIAALMRGEAVETAELSPTAQGARRNQERDALAQLAREILVSLAQVEQTLDDFFRNHEKRAPLAGLAGPLHQIEGALSLLGDEEALALVHGAAEEIAAFAAATDEPDAEATAALAHRLSALGFYIQALQHGPASLDAFLNPGAAGEESAELEEAEYPPPEAADETTAPAIEPAPAPARTAAPAAAEPPPAEPTAPPAEEEPAPPEAAPDEFDAEDLPPPPLEIPAPAAETQRLIEASDAEVDAELLEIFIEEAQEVLASIGEHLELSRTEPSNTEYFTAIRRGFHTLKGSGRMVGLRDLGESAWGMEQTLNRWLQLEWTPTPALHHLVDAAHQVFSDWVAQLHAGGAHQRDTAALLAEAERLRDSEQPIHDPLPIADAVVHSAETPAEPERFEFDLSLSEEGEVLPVAHTDGPPAEQAADDATSTVLGLADFNAPPDDTVEEALESIDLEILGDEFDSEEAEAPPAAPVDEQAPPPPDAEQTEAGAAEEIELQPLAPIAEQAPPATDTAEAEAPLLEHSAPDDADALPAAEAGSPADTWPDDENADFIRIGDAEISRPLYDLYLAEARHHLSTLHQEIVRLRANPTQPPLEVAVRAAHTLAGISGTARLTPLQALARALEYAQARCRDNQLPPSAEQVALLQSSLETLEAMLVEVSARTLPLPVPELIEQLETVGRRPAEDETPPPPALGGDTPDALLPPQDEAPAREAPPPVHDEIDTQLLPIFLEESGDLLGELHGALRAWRNEPDSDEFAQRLARQLHTLKGSARMTGAMNLGEHVHQMETTLEAARRAGSDPAAIIDELESSLDLAEQAIDALASGDTGAPRPPSAPLAAAPGDDAPRPAAPAAEPVEVAAEHETGSGSATLRVRADAVDHFVNQAGEIGIARTRIEGELRTLRRSLLDLTENVIRLRNQLREVEIQAEVQMQSRIAQAESHHAEFDPLEMDRYTRLQELTRMMAESVNDVTTVQQNLLKNLDGADVALHGQARMSRELQQALMQVRMVPFENLADRLHRVVRQSAKDLGKRATLDLRGGRIELDRGVLEHMVAPLEHLLRNSIAHGIEAPAARREAGKAEIGEITLTVRQEGNEIAIDLADDGAGLDFARIAERARANGLLGADEQADEKRLTNLIFVPGFSTAGSVSTLSGRGVGMDVVKSETAALGGRLDVSSQPGQGTRFRIYLPLTLAVTQALLVRAGNRSWAVPSSMIAQVLELKADALERLRTEGGTEWQDEHYSYRYLPRLLGDRHTQPEVQRFNWILLLRAGAQTLALHVDGLRGNQEIVVKNAGPQVARLVGVSGATVLGDGEIVLILNPVALASRGLGAGQDAAGSDGALAAAPLAAPAPAHIPTVMVVDDSLTVRKITGRLLEREGYRVITAKDGVDALEKLLESVPDVVLSDIEMPRMDGFDLVRNIRADERTRAVPVIMITSRLADKHRRYAEEVGANHYLGKPYQEEELLALLAGYTGAH
ncbi:response regulator [Pseudothauera nasutitermitis]|uniref:Chemotaxis protein CheA n=1 Tax=Pseudothauera nasutitermitis TaxID=2565930 RepID=A0A4S4AVI7_9RHOO|nr:Hpt domain-containing protein [Pseudothauera nasutitermitis]THF63844.1 response regulator [Pseudothauera nasutitermitis]